MKSYNTAIIGTGQAGPPLARALAEFGLRVAIIEMGALGGSCVNEGCTPTKAYVASARRAWAMRNGRELGIKLTGEVQPDLKAIKARKDKIIADKHTQLRETLDHENIELIRGRAEFEDEHILRVNGESLRAERIVINVGSRPRIPEGFGTVGHLTNRDVLMLEEIPEHLLIVGGGNIGLEFGQMFRRFGSKITILDRNDSLLPGEDPDIGPAIADMFRDEGIALHFGSDCLKADGDSGKVNVHYKNARGDHSVSGSHVLLAVGRVPNTDALGLEKAGIRMDDRGYIQVGESLKTNVDHIWALGDCNGRGGFTHTSYNDFQIAESHLLGDGSRTLNDRFPCHATFIDPALARVGMNLRQIKENGIEAKVGEIPMDSVARAIEKGETRGLMRAYIDARTDQFLGATFLGAGADEYIHVIIAAMYGGVPYQKLRDAVHIHPTVSELIPTLLEELKNPEEL